MNNKGNEKEKPEMMTFHHYSVFSTVDQSDIFRMRTGVSSTSVLPHTSDLIIILFKISLLKL